MSGRRLPLFPALAAAPLLVACDPDCRDPARLDGLWDLDSHAGHEEAFVTGFADEEAEARNELLALVFANGPSEWDLTYVPNRSDFTLRITEQPYEASYAESDEGCNRFSMDFAGTYTSAGGSRHDFTWTGELLWSGDELDGTFSYEDQWTWEDRSGTVSIPGGQLHGALQG